MHAPQISYTMLPPSLNLVFSIFSCLEFEDGSKTLRADHMLSCQVSERDGSGGDATFARSALGATPDPPLTYHQDGTYSFMQVHVRQRV